jgi:hypothetical protein
LTGHRAGDSDRGDTPPWRIFRPEVALSTLLVLLLGFADPVRAGERLTATGISIFGAPGNCQFGYRMRMSIENGNVLYRGQQVSPRHLRQRCRRFNPARHRQVHRDRLGRDHRPPRRGPLDGGGLRCTGCGAVQ